MTAPNPPAVPDAWNLETDAHEADAHVADAHAADHAALARALGLGLH